MRSHMWKYAKYTITYKYVQIYAKINIQNFENAIAVKYAICGFFAKYALAYAITCLHITGIPNHSPERGT